MTGPNINRRDTSTNTFGVGVDRETWELVKTLAAKEDRTNRMIVTRALQLYVAEHYPNGVACEPPAL